MEVVLGRCLFRATAVGVVNFGDSAIEDIIGGNADLEARGRMLLGAAMAGSAIEDSMLGGAHALANPLTAHFDVPHGHAVSLMLPHVIRFNSELAETAAIYGDLSHSLGTPLVDWVDSLIRLAGLKAPHVPTEMLSQLAADATQQWTGNFNPRPLTENDFLTLYHAALASS